eukprot:TRINITY_DN11964_c0_g2_i1.p1 TRINITY_DN11964_c0_g2~~TRINITY_DN11964_c0_g2_i1.p1  ORF type:complete len:239 (+),score=20.41 TRINITY_DN11964_c0_g2_i1:3-719(+)
MEDHKKANSAPPYPQMPLSASDLRKIIKAVADVLASQIEEDQASKKSLPEESELKLFDEGRYLKPDDPGYRKMLEAINRIPTNDNVFDFMNALQECAGLSPETFVTCLVYINRLIVMTGVPLLSTTWRPLVLCSLLVSQKVWNDNALSNADFAFICPFFTSEEVSKLERTFVRLLEYTLVVNRKTYTQYHFELRSLFPNESDFPLHQLQPESCQYLEDRSTELQKLAREKAENLARTC